jgi:archaellum component FlaC
MNNMQVKIEKLDLKTE